MKKTFVLCALFLFLSVSFFSAFAKADGGRNRNEKPITTKTNSKSALKGNNNSQKKLKKFVTKKYHLKRRR